MSSVPSRRRVVRTLAWLALPAAFLLTIVWNVLNHLGIPPRRLSPYIAHRVSGHNPVIVGVGRWVSDTLQALDRPTGWSFPVDRLTVGANPSALNTPPSGPVILVSSAEAAVAAIAQAQPGDVITFAPGDYRFSGGRGYIGVTRAGTASQPIVVRAPYPGSVRLKFDLTQGFLVTAPYWTFENLDIQGVCKDDTTCEHAFHIMGDSHHFVARNNHISDFDAHFKINEAGGKAPDNGLLEYNTLTESHVRRTSKPVTGVDLVAASHWMIRHNLITDFIKGDGDRISYGAYAKGGGSHNHIQQNIVVCENRLAGSPGQRVGISLGGGGTGPQYCRDQRCIVEQQYSTIDSNLVMSCSDDGIELRKAAASQITGNTLLDTGPILVRFPESSADISGNLVDGDILSRDGGIMRAGGNLSTSTALLYLGQHPVRRLFVDAANLRLSWAGPPPEDAAHPLTGTDLCGQARSTAIQGAFQDFHHCQAKSKPSSTVGSPP